MGRPSAGERLKRLLALLPWLAAHPGSTIAEISERFGLSAQQLEDDLAVVWMVGIPPYTPDQLIDVEFDGDRVSVNLGSYFQRPLRLTNQQALALVAAGQSLVSVPGTDPEGPLARGLGEAGHRPAGRPRRGDGRAPGRRGERDPGQRLRAASEDGRRVRIDYYSFGRDERSRARCRPPPHLGGGRGLVPGGLVPQGRRASGLPPRPHRRGRGAGRRRVDQARGGGDRHVQPHGDRCLRHTGPRPRVGVGRWTTTPTTPSRSGRTGGSWSSCPWPALAGSSNCSSGWARRPRSWPSARTCPRIPGADAARRVLARYRR